MAWSSVHTLLAVAGGAQRALTDKPYVAFHCGIHDHHSVHDQCAKEVALHAGHRCEAPVD